MDEDADSGVEEGQFTVQGRAGRDPAAHPSAQSGPQLSVHRLVVQGVLQLQVETGAGACAQPVAFLGLGEVLRGADGPLEQRTAACSLGRVHEVLVDLLEDEGDRVQVGGPEGKDRRGEGFLVQIGFMAHQEATAHAEPLDHEAVHVGEREEGEDGGLLSGRSRRVFPAREQCVGGARQAAMRQGAAPGASRRAGGVGDDRRGVGQHDPAQRVDRRRRYPAAPLDQL